MARQTSIHRTRRRWFAGALITLALLVVGAEFAIEGPPWAGTQRVLWRGSSVRGHLSAHFRYFDGSEGRPFSATAGRSLTLRYDLEPGQGVLAVHVLSPEGNDLWTRSATRPAQGSATVPLPESGRYRVEVTGAKTRGSFTVDYRLAASTPR